MPDGVDRTEGVSSGVHQLASEPALEIVFVTIPAFPKIRRCLAIIWLAALCPVALIAVVWLLYELVPDGPIFQGFQGDALMTIIIASLVGAIGVVLLAAVWRAGAERDAIEEARRGLHAVPSSGMSTPVTLMLLEMGVGRPMLWPDRFRKCSWEQLEWQRTERGLPRLKTVVDESMRGAVEAIGRPSAPPEPVRIRPKVHVSYVLAAFLITLVLYPSSPESEVHKALFGLILCIVLVKLAGSLRPANWPVAGPGSLQERGRRWTVEDSTMVISALPRKGSLRAWVVGPAGDMSLLFARPDHPDFVKLWQRWTYPQASPEVLRAG